MSGDGGDELDKDYTPEEQDDWDERGEHERVREVTGVGPYDIDEGEQEHD
jgi:hypothetical protein